MAYPTILINSATGSDTAASGAGPSSAKSGTGEAYTYATDGTIVYFPSSISLESIVDTGEHVIYINDATAGARNFASISGVCLYQGAVNGDTTVSSTQVTNSSTTYLAVNQVVIITGAGAAGADLTSYVTSITDAATFDIADAAQTATTGTNVFYYQTLKTNEAFAAGLADKDWAVGGKRASINSASSRKLVNNNSATGDAVFPGWRIQFESGHTETLTSTLTIYGNANALYPFIFEGNPSAAVMPVLTWNNASGNGISYGTAGNNFYAIRYLDLRLSHATKTNRYAVSGYLYWDLIGCRIDNQANNWGIGFNAYFQFIKDCSIAYTTSTGLSIQYDAIIENTIVHHCGGVGINLSGTAAYNRIVKKCLVYANTGVQISTGGTAGLSGCIRLCFEENVIHGGTSDGIKIADTGSAGASRFLTIINNQITGNGGYGINFSGGVTDVQLNGENARIWNNNFGVGTTSNTSGASNLSLSASGKNNLTVNPGYADSSTGNFSPGTAVKALGFPLTNIANGVSSTRSYFDIGAVQRQEQGGETSHVF